MPAIVQQNNCDTRQERQERRIRQIRRQVDWQWLNACLGKRDFILSHVPIQKKKLLTFTFHSRCGGE